MRILDKYILKKYLFTFLFVLLILIPVIIAIDTGDKIDKFLRHEDLTVGEIIQDYYVNFMINIANMVLPLALFVSVLWFTSKLASQTEIIAINSAKISFTRFLKPYFVGATIIALASLSLNHFVVPKSTKVYNEFKNTYIKSRPVDNNQIININLQLSDNEFVYIKTFYMKQMRGNDFTFERYEGNKLVEKLSADRIQFREKDTTYRLTNYYRKKLKEKEDIVTTGRRMDTLFDFKPKDLLHLDAFAQEMQTPELLEYIQFSQSRGRGNLNVYYVELYKRTSLAVAVYILTLIAVCLGSVKRRGGIGINLAIGVTMVFLYVFLLKIVEVIGGAPNSSPIFMVWLPNILFGSVAIYLYFKVR
ncbi:LptF/LptG family permease [Urechidicola sp. KH5]